MIHLRAVSKVAGGGAYGYPYTVPTLQRLQTLRFAHPVTFFVGENGTGKSTLMEGIAAGIHAIAVGGQDIEQDESLAPARALAQSLQFQWSTRTRRGFFLRSEDFFNFAGRMAQLTRDLEQMASEYEEQLEENPNRSGLGLAVGALRAQRDRLIHAYGANLDANSHGEGFLKLFQSRITPGGLYLMDEPEAALSPTRQLAFLSLLKRTVTDDNCQFIIATHSPILMAYPDAQILSFDESPIAPVAYETLEHVTLTRDFLQNPQAFLRHL